MGGERLVGEFEDAGVAAKLPWKDDERRDDHDVEHHVFDDGDNGGSTEAARIGIDRKDDEGDDERGFACAGQGSQRRLSCRRVVARWAA